MSKISQLNSSLLYLLIFTIITSATAYYLVIRAYDDVLELTYQTHQ